LIVDKQQRIAVTAFHAFFKTKQFCNSKQFLNGSLRFGSKCPAEIDFRKFKGFLLGKPLKARALAIRPAALSVNEVRAPDNGPKNGKRGKPLDRLWFHGDNIEVIERQLRGKIKKGLTA